MTVRKPEAGMKVVIVSDPPDRWTGTTKMKVTTIKKVAGNSFSVTDDREPRFSNDTWRSKRIGDTWGSYRQAYPADSDDGLRACRRGMRERTIARIKKTGRELADTPQSDQDKLAELMDEMRDLLNTIQPSTTDQPSGPSPAAE